MITCRTLRLTGDQIYFETSPRFSASEGAFIIRSILNYFSYDITVRLYINQERKISSAGLQRYILTIKKKMTRTSATLRTVLTDIAPS